MRVLVYLKSFGDNQLLMLEALVDTGASHSFLNPKVLSRDVNNRIEAFKKIGVNSHPNELGLNLINASIQTINNKRTTFCVEATVSIQINTWCGQQDFIISSQIENEACILGRNFLKQNGVRIDYGTDYMEIPFKMSTTNATGQPRVDAIGCQQTEKQIYRIEKFSEKSGVMFVGMLLMPCVQVVRDLWQSVSSFFLTVLAD